MKKEDNKNYKSLYANQGITLPLQSVSANIDHKRP